MASTTIDVQPTNVQSFQAEEHEEEDTDIYRGGPPQIPRSSSPDRHSTASSSSSSFGSILTRGRLGAIAAILDQAITRWARSPGSSSSSSTSSSSERSASRSFIPRRKRRNADSRNSQRLLIARTKAREHSRQSPREFVLYLPPPTNPHAPSRWDSRTPSHSASQRVTRTTSLGLTFEQLDSVLKRSRRGRGENRRNDLELLHPEGHGVNHQHTLPETPRSPSSKIRNGKQRQPSSQTNSKKLLPLLKLNPEPPKVPKAWWLDISSPSWEDIREIGKTLQIHPLTLEDILQQDPREKYELFPKLGYHFIVFRAIEHRANGPSQDLGPTGKVGEANVYLVVFRDGICSFHFTDISEHTDRVRNRVLQLQETINMTSDWIAHGLLDSIVDSYFPFLEEIEKEVSHVERIVFSDAPILSNEAHVDDAPLLVLESPEKIGEDKPSENEKSNILLVEKSQDSQNSKKRDNKLFRSRISRSVISNHLRLSYQSILASLPSFRTQSPQTTTQTTLHRMARTRRLVTSLARLLATKSDVVLQVKKRSMEPGRMYDLEVAFYMEDVHDHILTLQQSLTHYERMLSQSHPTYLSQLRISVAKTKSGSDKAVMVLTIISMAVLCIQTLIGVFSMNCTVPANNIPSGPFYMFGVVLVSSVTILASFLRMVRLWWVRARRKRGTKL